MYAYKRILVPTDGTALSLKAVREAATLAKGLKATIAAVYVKAPWTPPVVVDAPLLPAEAFDERAYLKAAEATAQAALGKVREAADKAKVRCETFAVTDDEPWKGIVKTASAKKCDLIVMASHGRTGVAAALLGSETRKVLAHATKPVLVCH